MVVSSPSSTYNKEVSDVSRISILIAQARMLKALVKVSMQTNLKLQVFEESFCS